MKTRQMTVKAVSPSIPETADPVPAQSTPDHVAPEIRLRMIAAAAYLRAEQRGFQNGTPDDDWLQAEMEVDEFLAETRRARSGLDLSFDELTRTRSGT